MIDLNLHFGCGLYVYDSGRKKSEVEQLMELFTSMVPEEDDPKWKEHNSFFMSLQGEMDFDFSDGAKVFKPKISLDGITGTDLFDKITDPLMQEVNISDGIPMIFGILKDFRPIIKELKVYDRNGNAKIDEADKLNEKISNLKNLSKSNPALAMVTDKIFGQGFPMVPFPDVERCLGLKAKDSTMQIQDGYAILAFDYNVKSSNQDCLFDIKGSLADKELRMAGKNKGFSGFDLGKATKKLQALAEENARSFKLPPLSDFPKIDFNAFKNLDFQDAMSMVKVGQKGFNMIQDNLDHPLVKDGLDKLKDSDVMNKLKDVDVGDAMNKFKDMSGNLGEAKKHASNVFKLF